MSLYLATFGQDGIEIDGVECGRYADFNSFRDAVLKYCKSKWLGPRFPLLLNHSDCDGEWPENQVEKLRKELEEIKAEFTKLPPAPFQGDWQAAVARQTGLVPRNLAESFIDVDGEPLLDRLLSLCTVAARSGRPIEFQ
jgi:hypothetical protein